jgi:2-dehydro-3-deoxygluconokinase
MANQFDVVTLGETMLRLTPPQMKRIEQATGLEIEVGGSESNTSIGLARLGLKVSWVSRLTQNGLGYLIANTVRGHGVDTTWLRWTEQDRIGLYFLEEGLSPRGSAVVYDRANSAFSRIHQGDLSPELFQPEISRALHLTGITPAVSPSAAQTALKAREMAKNAGWAVSFDLNYRARLWSPGQARLGCDPFCRAADLLIAPVRDARLIYDLPETTSPQHILAYLQKLYPQATLVLTMGKEGAIGQAPQGELIHQPVFTAAEVGRIGGGDAFAAGLLYGFLGDNANRTFLAERLGLALRWGAAVAALKYSTPGDLPVISHAEAARLVASDSSSNSATLTR